MDKESNKSTDSAVTESTSPRSVNESADARDAEVHRAMLRTKLELAEADAAHTNDLLKLADGRVKALEALVRELQAGAAAAPAASERDRVRTLEAQLRVAQARAAAAEKLSEQTQLLIDAMLCSSSWRISSPIRAGGMALRKIGGSKALPTSMVARRVVQHGAAYVRSRPALKEGIANMLTRFPSIRARLIRLAGFDAVQGMLAGAQMPAVETVDRLTARGRRIHADLLSAKNAHTK